MDVLVFRSDPDTRHAKHADSVDYTLCGMAMEGENGDDVSVEFSQSTINCPGCIRIIEHCRAMPRRWKAK